MDSDVAAARRIVDSNRYLTLATADDQGRPWVSPVWFASSGYRQYVWASSPLTRHSRNIAARSDVAIVIFDSTVCPGSAAAIYIAAHAEQVPDAEFEHALAGYAQASVSQGLPTWSEHDVRAPAKHRLYRATATETFMLNGNDERDPVDITAD